MDVIHLFLLLSFQLFLPKHFITLSKTSLRIHHHQTVTWTVRNGKQNCRTHRAEHRGRCFTSLTTRGTTNSQRCFKHRMYFFHFSFPLSSTWAYFSLFLFFMSNCSSIYVSLYVILCFLPCPFISAPTSHVRPYIFMSRCIRTKRNLSLAVIINEITITFLFLQPCGFYAFLKV